MSFSAILLMAVLLTVWDVGDEELWIVKLEGFGVGGDGKKSRDGVLVE